MKTQHNQKELNMQIIKKKKKEREREWNPKLKKDIIFKKKKKEKRLAKCN